MLRWLSSSKDDERSESPSPREGGKKRRALKYVVGRDSHAVRAVEHLPVASSIAEFVHKRRGHTEQAERAKFRNPMGTNGVITQTAELVPGISDAIRCLHHFRGEDEAAERARGNSLEKYLGKDGALTRTAELLPGSNLVAAVLLETSGNHEEAKRAVNILRNWQNVGSPDGALTKLAEMFPGTDLVAFGLHASHGDFAHALRSVVKTRYLDIDADILSALMVTGNVENVQMAKLHIGETNVHPVTGPVLGALLDLVTKLLQSTAEKSHVIDPKMITGDISTTIVEIVNTLISKNIEQQLDNLDDTVAKNLENLKPVLEARRSNAVMKQIVPSSIPPPREDLFDLLRQIVPKVTIDHGHVPYIRHLQPKYTKYSKGLPEGCGAISALSCAGCFAFHWPTCMLGCFTGCVAGVTQGLRAVSTMFVPKLNDQNASAATRMRRPVRTVMARRLDSKALETPKNERPHGVVVEVPHVPELVDAATGYVLDEVLSSWRFGRFIAALLRSVVPALRAFLADLLVSKSGSHAQVLVDLAVPAIKALDTPTGKLELPPMPLGVLLDLRLQGPGPLLERVRVVMADRIIDDTLQSAATQMRKVDLRSVVPQLETFKAPVQVQMELGIEWADRSQFNVAVRQPSVRLHLPE